MGISKKNCVHTEIDKYFSSLSDFFFIVLLIVEYLNKKHIIFR